MKSLKLFLVLFIFVGSSLVAREAMGEEATTDQQFYVVKRGDNFEKLSERYGVTAKEIIAANSPDKFGYTCVDPEEYTTLSDKTAVRCHRVYQWLRIGRTIVIPSSQKALQNEIEALRVEKENLTAEKQNLEGENRNLLKKLVKAQEKNAELLQDKKQEANSARSDEFRSLVVKFLIAISALCTLSFLILIISVFRKGRVRMIDPSESVKKAREDLIRDRQNLKEWEEAGSQRLAEKEEELNRREEELKGREKTIDGKEKALREAEPGRRDSGLDVNEEAKRLSGRFDEIQKRESAVSAKEEELAEKKKRFEAEKAEFAKQREGIDRAEEELAAERGRLHEEEKEYAMRALDQSGRRKSLDEKEKKTGEKERAVALEERRVVELKLAIEERETDLRGKEIELERRERSVREQEEAIARFLEERKMKEGATSPDSEFDSLIMSRKGEEGSDPGAGPSKPKVFCPECRIEFSSSEELEGHLVAAHSRMGTPEEK